MCSFKFDLQSILDETSFYMIKLHFSKLHEILAFSLVFAFEYFQSFKILSQYILNLYCLGWGWTIWSNLVNFCQYFMIRFVNSLNFFFLFRTLICDRFGSFFKLPLNLSYWALYFMFPGTDIKYQIVDKTKI